MSRFGEEEIVRGFSELVEHAWLCEHVEVRTGLAWGRCSCGWRSKGYQGSKDAWRRHVAAANRRVKR